MAIPNTIPAGFVNHTNQTTAKTVIYDRANPVTTLPVADQALLTPAGVVAEEQRVALNTGPRSYFEHTINSGTTTVEKLILT